MAGLRYSSWDRWGFCRRWCKEGWACELDWYYIIETGREVLECFLDFVARRGFVAEGEYTCALCRSCFLGWQVCRLCVRLRIWFRRFLL